MTDAPYLVPPWPMAGLDVSGRACYGLLARSDGGIKERGMDDWYRRLRDKYKPPYTIERLPAPGYRLVAGDGTPLIYTYSERKGLPGKQLSDEDALALVEAVKRMLETSGH